MLSRSLLIAVAFYLGLVLNPAYFAGCGGDASDATSFGEPEMLRLLDAANEAGSWEFDAGGSRYALDLVLTQSAGADTHAGLGVAPAAFAQRAYACGTRRFMNSAAACITFTEVPLEGELSLRQLAPVVRTLATGVAVHGALWTSGDRLLSASLNLSFSGGTAELNSPDARAFELLQFSAAAADEHDAIAFGVPTRMKY